MRGVVYVAAVYKFPNGKSKVFIEEAKDGAAIADYVGRQNLFQAYLFSTKQAANDYEKNWNGFFKRTGQLYER